jgi:hypothetical protein
MEDFRTVRVVVLVVVAGLAVIEEDVLLSLSSGVGDLVDSFVCFVVVLMMMMMLS